MYIGESHKYDSFLRYLTIISVILISIPVYAMIFNSEYPIEWKIAFFVSFIFLFCIIVYLKITRTLGSWLYCKYTLKIDLDFNQAKQLNRVLAPLNPAREWLDLKDYKNYHGADAFESLLKAANLFDDYNKVKTFEKLQQFKSMSVSKKILQIGYFLSVLFWISASLFNIYPCSLSNDLLSAYIPLDKTTIKLLTMSIFTLPTIFVFKIFNKDLIK